MNILLTNDDGVHAPGIKILQKTLSSIANVIVVAPTQERSTTGHTLTLDHTLRLIEIEENVFGCDGFPADCSLMGIAHIFKTKGQKVDLVISGINRGANLGQDIFYSGTVAAAREAVFHKVPAIAVSSCMDFRITEKNDLLYYTASNFIKKLVQLEVSKFIPPMTLLNVNVPWKEGALIKGLKTTKVGFRNYSEDISERVDFRGRNYYWIGGVYKGHENLTDSDCQAIEDDLISVSPIKLMDYGIQLEDLISSTQSFLDRVELHVE
jgi:5'-nucleotidase